MLGRSDGVLKPSGVRFGSAEIYNVLTKFFGGEIEDAVCVGRRRETDRDETVCLFVVMCEGRKFTGELSSKIQQVGLLAFITHLPPAPRRVLKIEVLTVYGKCLRSFTLVIYPPIC